MARSKLSVKLECGDDPAEERMPEVGWGDWKILPSGSPSVLGMRYDWRGNSLLVVHNFDERDMRRESDNVQGAKNCTISWERTRAARRHPPGTGLR